MPKGSQPSDAVIILRDMSSALSYLETQHIAHNIKPANITYSPQRVDAVVAANVVPYTPAGSEATTMLCSPIRPQVYEFVSLGFCEKPCSSWWRSSSRAVAAARSMGRAAIHPTV